MDKRKKQLTSILVSLFLLAGGIQAAPQVYEEYVVKTAFLYRSLHYVEWANKNGEHGTIVICVTGNDKFDQTIYSLQDRTVNGQTIQVKTINNITDVKGCDVLQVAAVETSKLKQTLAQLKNKNILTISDRHGYANQGVILNFPVTGQKVSIEINIDAANTQNIKFSAKLLRIAKIIGD